MIHNLDINKDNISQFFGDLTIKVIPPIYIDTFISCRRLSPPADVIFAGIDPSCVRLLEKDRQLKKINTGRYLARFKRLEGFENSWKAIRVSGGLSECMEGGRSC